MAEPAPEPTPTTTEPPAGGAAPTTAPTATPAGESTPGTARSLGAPPAEPTATVDESKPREDGKPGWLPAKFKSEEDLAKSYKELERKQFTRREDLRTEITNELRTAAEAGMPKAPVDYTFAPQKQKDGSELKLNPDDPLTKWFQNVAWEMKIPQAKFQQLVADYIKVDMQRGPDWKVEARALGAEADRRLDRVSGWARGNMPQELYDTFAKIPATASMIKLFEHVMTLGGEPAFQPDDSASGFKENLTRADLEAMMKDERYWRGKDKQFINQVRAGFRRITQ